MGVDNGIVFIYTIEFALCRKVSEDIEKFYDETIQIKL